MSRQTRVTRATASNVEIDLAVPDAGDIDVLPHHRRRLAASASGATSRTDAVDRVAVTPGRIPARVVDTEF